MLSHLHEASRTLAEARPIRIDKGLAGRMARQLLDKFEQTIRKGFLYVGSVEVRLDSRQKIRLPNGETKEVLAILQTASRRGCPSQVRVCGGRYVRDGDRIYVYLQWQTSRDSWLYWLDDPKLRRELEDEVASVMLHEMTHASEVELGAPTAGLGGGTEYHNRKSEVRAFMQEIANDVIRYYRANKKKLRKMSPSRAFEAALESSRDWVRRKEFWTERNRRLIIKGVYTALRDEGLA